MPETVHIAFAMTGDVHRNSRALRQLGALGRAGYRVALYSLPEGDIHSELPRTVEHHVIQVPGSGGPSYFLKVHRAFSREMAKTPAKLFHASDLYVLPAARRASAAQSARLTYDARELYAHVSATVGRPHVSAFWKLVERTSIRRADHVWTVSEPIAQELTRAYGISRPEVQMNAPPVAPLSKSHWIRDQAALPADAQIALHLGQMRKDRGGEALVGAMGHLPDSSALHLVFLGYGPEQEHLVALALKTGVAGRVHFLPPVPPAELATVASGAHVGVTLLEPTCLNHRLALPNKLFDYLAAGLPVVASNLPAIAGIVGGHNCGILVNPSDEPALAAALVRASANSAESMDWRRRARAAAETLDWNTVSQAYLDRIHSLIGPP